MHSLRQRLRELRARGFTQDLSATDGELCSADGTLRFSPEKLTVVEHHIFEGQSDPADASILFALEEPRSRTRALWIARRGVDASPEEVEILDALTHDDRRAEV